MKIKSSIVTNLNEDGTLSVLDLESNTFYELNEVATIVFNNIFKDKEEILDVIINEYEVTREQLNYDVTEIIGEFERFLCRNENIYV